MAGARSLRACPHSGACAGGCLPARAPLLRLLGVLDERVAAALELDDLLHGPLVLAWADYPTFGLAGAPLEPGLVYACLAETVLMGLEGATTHGSYGPVTAAGVEAALAMAKKHGFELGQYQKARAY